MPAARSAETPALPTVTAAELRCLSDDAYLRLAARERLRARESAELRALLGDPP